MANALFDKGREGFLDGSIDWDTNTISAVLLDLNTTDVGVKAITGATNATPIVITATSHGFSNGDTVFIDGVGGNLAANGLWTIASVATNTFNLTDPVLSTNVVGSAAYTSGGYAVCMGSVSTAGDNFDDFDACLVGSKVNLTTPTAAGGIATSASATTTFTAVTGASVEAVALIKDTGTNSTSRMIALITGKHIVTCAVQAAASATTIVVDPLAAPIASGQVLTFSNGATATLSGSAVAGARSISVSALAAIVTAGSRALAAASGSGLPVTPNGGNITVTWDTGTNKIFKL
jgi:hypothetical protein